MITHGELKRHILRRLTHSPMHIASIVSLTGEPVEAVTTTLALMELCDEVLSPLRLCYALPIPDSMSKFRPEEVYIIDYVELSAIVSEYLGVGFGIVEAEELRNNMIWSTSVGDGPSTRLSVSRRRECARVVESIRNQEDTPIYNTALIMDQMHYDGLLLPGRYLVEIFW